MNEMNLEYLKKLLFHLGFGDKLNAVLETAINRELPKFTLGLSNVQRPLENPDLKAGRTDLINYQLHFNRDKNSDAYFLNEYQVTLHKTGESIPRTQVFDLERDHRITALQAFKLLSGLSFQKDVYVRAGSDREGQSDKMPMWFRLNLEVTDAYSQHPLKKMRPEYGYDLTAALDKYPFKFKSENDKVEALRILATGNYYHGELSMGQKSIGVLIAANPQMKTVDIYDAQLKEIRDTDIWPEQAAARTTVVTPPAAESLAAGQEFEGFDQSTDSGPKVGR